MPIDNHEERRDKSEAFREKLSDIPAINGTADNLHVLQESPKRESAGSESDEPRPLPEPAMSGGDTSRLASIKLEDIAPLSQRTKNVLAANSISSIRHLCDLSPNAIESFRQGGTVTHREMLQAMLQRFIRPGWMHSIARKFRYDLLLAGTPVFYSKLVPVGYNQVTTEYDPSEYWMLEVVIADMIRGAIDYCIVREQGTRYTLYRKGGLIIE